MKIFVFLCSLSVAFTYSNFAYAEVATNASPNNALCQISVGTKLIIETTQVVNSETAQPGETYTIRLAEPVTAGGKVIVNAGVSGKGEIIHAQRRQGFSGRAGELIIAARYLEADGFRVKLGKSSIEIAGEQSRGFVFNGGSVAPSISSESTEIPAGTFTEAEVVSDCMSIADFMQSNSPKNAIATINVARPIPQISNNIQSGPTEGFGRVVIYRVAYHADGYGSSCKIKAGLDGQEQLLPNIKGNTYLVFDARPGVHQFSVKVETSDRLALEIEQGQTKYLQCVMTTGILRARPDIRPSSEREFASFPKLKPLPLVAKKSLIQR